MDDCKGCLSLVKKIGECRCTRFGIANIPDCPCMNCILKVMCTKECNDFLNAKIKHSEIITTAPAWWYQNMKRRIGIE